METGLTTRSIVKYNFFVNPFTSCKTDIIISHYNAGHTYRVKGVTLKNHSNNGLAILSIIYTDNFLLSVLMHISPTMHYNAGHSYKINTHYNTGADEFGNKFSPWEDFFINPFGSDVISPNQLCKCTCMYISTGAGRSTCSGTMKRFCSREV